MRHALCPTPIVFYLIPYTFNLIPFGASNDHRLSNIKYRASKWLIELTAQRQHIAVIKGAHFVGQLIKQLDHTPVVGRSVRDQPGNVV